ncbi:acyltransferase domain-containing protein [Acerihabitans sp. KWT182]|uniref:Acyltransferase domain-containing protein n=1 Tax=Acerihabitans sp. KWT182 TaxID=3157919 RepID=A0AAU7Q483_9GAMM
MGEFSAACCAGVLTLEQTLAAVVARGRIMEAIRADGQMLAVLAEEEQLLPLLDGCSGVTVAARNSPRSTVLSVDASQADNVKALLDSAGLAVFPVNPHYAFHGPQIERLSDPLRAAFRDLQPVDSPLMVASATLGDIIEGRRMDAHYWAANARRPVQFSSAIARLLDAGIDDFFGNRARRHADAAYQSMCAKERTPGTGRGVVATRQTAVSVVAGGRRAAVFLGP